MRLADGQAVYCVWISRDPEDPGEGGRSCANLTLASSLNSTMGGASVDASQFAEASAVSLGEVRSLPDYQCVIHYLACCLLIVVKIKRICDLIFK